MDSLGSAMERLGVIEDEAPGAEICSVLREVAWKLGDETLLFQHLQDDQNCLSEERIGTVLQEAGSGVTAATALDWLDANRDGKVCKDDFEKKVLHNLFTSQFVGMTLGCVTSALTAAVQSLPAERRGIPAVRSLAEMTDEDLERCVDEVKATLISSLKQLRQQVKDADQRKQPPNLTLNKFAFQPAEQVGPTFLLGVLQEFKQGLEALIGLPAEPVSMAMQLEHSSTIPFTTAEGVATFPRQEYDLVVDAQAEVDYAFDGERQRVDIDALMEAFRDNPALQTLTREEVVALVLCSGPMSAQYNHVLCSVFLPMAQGLAAGGQLETSAAPVPFSTTMLMISSAIAKMSEHTPRAACTKVYRGLQGKQLRDVFRAGTLAAGGGEATVQTLGFMAATQSIERAMAAAASEDGGRAAVVEIELGEEGAARGASLSALSQYGGESEILFPPMTCVRVSGEPRLELVAGAAVWVVPARVAVGKCTTREQFASRWKRAVMDTAREVLLDTQAGLLATLGSAEKSTPEDGTLLYQALMAEGAGLQQRMRELPAVWFEEPQNASMALQDLVAVRGLAGETMEAFATHPLQHPAEYFAQHSMTTWRRLRIGDARAAYAGLKGAGANAYAAATKLAELEGRLAPGDAYRWGGLDGETAVVRAAAAGDVSGLRLLADAQCDLNAVSGRQSTALLAAVSAGQAEAVGCLLALKADPNMGKIDTGESPLLHAAEHVRGACVQQLVAGGADVRWRSSASGATALHEAVLKGAVELLPCLVEAGADIRAVDDDGDEPVHVAAMYGQVQCVGWLKEAGADVTAARASDGNQPIHLAAANGHVMCGRWLTGEGGADACATNAAGNQPIHLGHAVCCKWLQEAGADVNAVNRQGSRAVHVAAGSGQLERLMWLKEAGADLLAANNHGNQALHLAVMYGHVACARWLKEAGADIHASNNAGDQAIHLAALYGQTDCGRWLAEAGADTQAVNKQGLQPIHVAVGRGHADWVAWLQGAKADVNAVSNSGDRPIHLCVWNGHAVCASALQALGADLRAPNATGSQPIHLAAWKGFVECMAVLHAGGADLDAEDTQGDRPVHLAARAGHAACVGWLKAAGADVQAVNGNGLRAIEEAAANDNAEVLQLLTYA